MNTSVSGLKVLILTPRFDLNGGIEQYLHDMVRCFLSEGMLVQVVSLADAGNPICHRSFEYKTLKVFEGKPGWISRKVWPLIFKNKFKDSTYDILIAAHISVLPELRQLGKVTKTPCVLIVYGLEVWGGQPLKRLEAIPGCVGVVSISDFTTNRIRVLQPELPEVAKIPPAIDLSRYPVLKTPRMPLAPFRILTVGRLQGPERPKGHEVIMRSMKILGDKYGMQTVYKIAGTGPDVHRLQDLATALDLRDQVEFLGRVSDEALGELYEWCDIFAMPNQAQEISPGLWAGEGFGIVFIEANAYGKPVLASPIGGQEEVVRNGENGLLVAPDPGVVSDALFNLFSRPSAMLEMGRRGREWVTATYTLHTFCLRWLDFIASHDKGERS